MTETWKPKFNPWLVTVIVSVAAFMELLDTSIANVALPHIAGNLGATNDESLWVLTSYLVSNAIILPISGWLVSVFGRKRYFLASLALFTVSSIVCGMAPSLGILLLARVIQGAGGGGLQPMVQAILADSFPPAKRGVAFAVFGITAIVAPAVGPTLGGWITDNYSWRWIFLINLPVGIIAAALIWYVLEDPPFLKRAANIRIDYIGFSLLALGIGSLQIMLDKGQEEAWFDSRFITVLALISAVSLITLVVWELFQKEPIIDIRLFKSSNFAMANIMMFTVGAVLFAGTVLMPQYLQTLMGYSSLMAGLAMSLGAMVLFFEMPVVGQLSARVPGKYLLIAGWATLALTMYTSAKVLNLGMNFGSAAWLRLIQSLPLPFIFIPATMAAYVGIPREKSNEVAGMVNFMRNIGSGVGTSLVASMLARRAQVHQTMLVSHTSWADPAFRDAVKGLAAKLAHAGVLDAQTQALARIYGLVKAQSAALAFVDAYWLVAAGAAAMIALAVFMKKNDPHAGGQVSVH
jgi:DHA2 family multidrug resistance protein